MQDDTEKIRHLASVAVKQFQSLVDFSFTFDADSVKWVDGFIERQRLEQPLDQHVLVNVIGSYLGEAIIANYGGKWYWDEKLETFGVQFDERNSVFPFAKVQKQFEHGEGDSIFGMFLIIPVVFKDVTKQVTNQGAPSSKQKKPWWRFGK